MEKANHAQTKLHNSQLVLNLIYEKGPISRAEIVNLTSLTPPTVSRLVAELIESDLVDEIGYGPSTGGKRPILLRVNDDARHLIGLDLGAGSFSGAIINLRGKVCHRASLPLQDRTGEGAPAPHAPDRKSIEKELRHLKVLSAVSRLCGRWCGWP